MHFFTFLGYFVLEIPDDVIFTQRTRSVDGVHESAEFFRLPLLKNRFRVLRGHPVILQH